MFKVINGLYKGVKTYKTVKSAVKQVEVMSNNIRISTNKSESSIRKRAEHIISNLEKKFDIDIPEDILYKLLEIGFKFAEGKKASVEKRDLCYMIVKYLYKEAKDIYYYIEKYFKRKKNV